MPADALPDGLRAVRESNLHAVRLLGTQRGPSDRWSGVRSLFLHGFYTIAAALPVSDPVLWCRSFLIEYGREALCR
ncbi:hypothetical protein NITLEN_10161 [Nitrospira lenta]|uniref:Uncharacterized protein n=1 Tax=Nitrospira lenta TaxID=1436998 RepID=A0A330KZZ3_9BACT|nr:hypothetical protein NITLEN_10161 [Nitrospira lenta]